jgi:hypothetical protein
MTDAALAKVMKKGETVVVELVEQPRDDDDDDE